MITLLLSLAGWDINEIIVFLIVFAEALLVIIKLLSLFFDNTTTFGRILRKVFKGLKDAKDELEALRDDDSETGPARPDPRKDE